MKLTQFFALVFIIFLLGCSQTPPPQQSALCDGNKPKVKTTGNMKMGVNNKGEVINEVSIGFGVSTILGNSGNSSC